MAGIQRAKRIGGFFNKPVKEKSPIIKSTLSRQVKSTEETNTHLANRNPSNYDPFESLDQRIGALKKTYRQYNRDEQELEENLKQLSDRSKKIIERLKLLLSAYNQAIVSLRAFDDAFKTDYMLSIEDLLVRNQYRLKSYGIFVQPTYEIDFDPDLFLTHIIKDSSVFPYLFSNKHGFFIRLCDIFRHIKLPPLHPQTPSDTKIEGTMLDHRI